jgi:hypothetical protein
MQDRYLAKQIVSLVDKNPVGRVKVGLELFDENQMQWLDFVGHIRASRIPFSHPLISKPINALPWR